MGQDENLFGKEFRTHLAKSVKAKNETLAAFKPKKKPEFKARVNHQDRRKPFQRGPPQQTNGGRGQKRYFNSNNQQGGKAGKLHFIGSSSCRKFDISIISSRCGTKICKSNNKRYFYRRHSKSSSGRPSKTFFKCLGKSDKGPRNSFDSGGLQNSSHYPSSTNRCTKNPKVINVTKGTNRQGDIRYAQERSNSICIRSSQRGIFKQSLSSGEKGQRVQTSNKFEGSEQTCAIPAFQNGRVELFKIHARRRGLHVQIRHERRLFFNTFTERIQEINSLFVVSQPLRISLPLFWVGSSAQGIYKTFEGPNSSVEEIQHKNNYLSGRHADSSKIQGRSLEVSRYSDLPTSEFRFCNESKEISDGTGSGNRIPWSNCKFIDINPVSYSRKTQRK